MVIAAGRAQPLHSRLLVGADIHGETGLDGPAFGEPTVQAETVDAIEFMRQVIMEPGRQVTLIATGPLTNVAALMLAHPEAAGRLREIVVMGGSTERGNVTPYAEFNVYADPEAADIVFGSGLPVTMCGLNRRRPAPGDRTPAERPGRGGPGYRPFLGPGHNRRRDPGLRAGGWLAESSSCRSTAV